MTIVDTEEEKVVVEFIPRVITGGKDSDYNWLYHMPAGSQFLARNHIEKGFIIFIFTKVRNIGETIAVEIMDRFGAHDIVDSERFSQQMELIAGREPDEDIQT